MIKNISNSLPARLIVRHIFAFFALFQPMKPTLKINQQLNSTEILSRRISAKSKYEHYFQRIKNLWTRNSALNNQYPSHIDKAFLRHVETDAILHIRELQDCCVSFPNWQDMVTVQGETDLRVFLQVGRDCFEKIFKHIPEKPSLKILDFGVGCGRTARHFYYDFEKLDMYGCDVDSSCINFLYREVPFLVPMLSPNKPPLAYDSSFFDVIYSVSVFSHFDKAAFNEWLIELARILKPGGRLIFTTHGLLAFNSSKKKNFSGMAIEEKNFSGLLNDFANKGFAWAPQETSSMDIDIKQYGISFVSEDYYHKQLPKNLKLVSYLEGEISGWQDMVIIERI